MNQHKLEETVEDGGAWSAAVHGVAESRTRLSNWTTTNNCKDQAFLPSPSCSLTNYLLFSAEAAWFSIEHFVLSKFHYDCCGHFHQFAKKLLLFLSIASLIILAKSSVNSVSVYVPAWEAIAMGSTVSFPHLRKSICWSPNPQGWCLEWEHLKVTKVKQSQRYGL